MQTKKNQLMKLYSYYLAMFISSVKLHSFSLKTILLLKILCPRHFSSPLARN